MATRTTYHHGDLKNTLMRVALQQIAATGARALSVREVSRAAGVSHTAAYRHFPSKDSLLAAIATQGFQRLRAAMQAGADAAGDDPFARIRACGVAYVDFGVQHPDQLQIMFGGAIEAPDSHPELRQAGKAAYEVLAAEVRAAVQAGQAQVESPRVAALAAWALVHGLAQLAASGDLWPDAQRRPDHRALANQVGMLLQQGLASRGVRSTSRRARGTGQRKA